MDQKLINLYQQMAELTAPECAHNCRCPRSCCDAMYCQLATERAAELGVTLTPGTHPKLPYMIDGVGCTVPPHIRPICTVHTCDINGFGFKRGDAIWTKKYFRLRDQIEKMELRREMVPPRTGRART